MKKPSRRMNIDQKKRLVEKFLGGEKNFEEIQDEQYPKFTRHKNKKKETEDVLFSQDMKKDYENEYKDFSKEDILKKIMHLEYVNIYQEKIIEKLKMDNLNLAIQVDELSKLIEK